MKDVEPYIVTLVDNIEHQGIGGKKFRIEKEGTMSYILDTNWDTMTIAMFNFIKRREDFVILPDDMKIYYGHRLDVNLGYFIAEDEIKGEQ